MRPKPRLFQRLMILSALVTLLVWSLPSLVAAEDVKSSDYVSIYLSHVEHVRVIEAADAALRISPISITNSVSPLSQGGKHDFHSNGDYC
jgi:hypothetical protein